MLGMETADPLGKQAAAIEQAAGVHPTEEWSIHLEM